MGPGDLLQLGGALLSGSALPFAASFLWRRLRRDPRNEAEARKLNAEADGFIVSRLYAEIERLDREMKDVRSELADVKVAAHDEKVALVQENKALRTQVGRLRRRVEGLEKILKVNPITPEMQRILDELPADDTDEAER